MTSKEAKTHIIDTINGDMNKEYFINEILPKIIQDLEVLQIIKDVFNYKSVQKFVDNMTKEDFFKVRGWFEYDK